MIAPSHSLHDDETAILAPYCFGNEIEITTAGPVDGALHSGNASPPCITAGTAGPVDGVDVPGTAQRKMTEYEKPSVTRK